MNDYKSQNEVSDQQLIQGFLNGRADDFNVLYERYKKQIYAYLNRLLPGQGALVDDIFQQTWIKVVNQLPKYQCQQKFLAWVSRISHNLAIDYFRKEKKREIETSIKRSSRMRYLNKSEEPWSDLSRKELSKLLEKALAELPAEQREVFLLRQDDISFKEIAEIQDCSINTALGRMQYALRHLRMLVGDMLEECQ